MPISKETRKKMSEGQKKRWAERTEIHREHSDFMRKVNAKAKEKEELYTLKSLPALHIDEESGASSSHLAPRYDLIPKNGMRIATKAWEIGATIHAPYNWRQGIASESFIRDRINHMFEHMISFLHPCYPLTNEELEKDLSAVIWGAMFLGEVLNYNEESRRVLLQILDAE